MGLELATSYESRPILASRFRVIFTELPKIILSGDQSRLFGDLNSLSAAPGVELAEKPAGMRLHCVLAYEQFFGDLAIAQSGCDQREDLILAGSDAECFEPFLIDYEWLGIAYNDYLFSARELEAEPDPHTSEYRRYEAP